MKKSKGFTLVELLAVIVILAILVLVATPAVTSIMQKSQKNSFKNEILQIAENMNTAFTEKAGKQVLSASTGADLTTTSVYNVKATEGTSETKKSYKYLCMTLKDLVNEQYVKKDLGTSYGGYIQMWQPDGSGSPIVFINVTNTSFYLQGRLSQMTNNGSTSIIPSQTAYASSETNFNKDTQTPTTAETFGCPKNFNIPSTAVTNVQEAE